MKTPHFVLISALIIILFTTGHSQERKHLFNIKSEMVADETYPIEVVLPVNYDSTLSYPVIYVTDWWFCHEILSELYDSLLLIGVINPAILVGISIEGDREEWKSGRLRDLTPTNIPEYDKPDSLRIGSRGISGGADNYLSFIEKELIPFIEGKYHCQKLNRGLIGYSLGGLFTAYALLNKPYLFQYYLIGSPSLSYDNFIVLESLENVPVNQLKMVKSAFISVGEMESGDALKGFADLRNFILDLDIPNLKLVSIIIEGKGHGSAVIPFMTNGFNAMYGTKQAIDQ